MVCVKFQLSKRLKKPYINFFLLLGFEAAEVDCEEEDNQNSAHEGVVAAATLLTFYAGDARCSDSAKTVVADLAIGARRTLQTALLGFIASQALLLEGTLPNVQGRTAGAKPTTLQH